MASAAVAAAVVELAPEFGLELDAEAVERVQRHYELLLTWNRKLNLTRITEPAEAARRHFLESAYLTRVVARPSALVDVGSGAGFPGVPLASVWTDTDAVLVEPLLKRAVFLKEVVRALELPRVTVVNRLFDASLVPSGALLVARALDRFRDLLPSLFVAPTSVVALFSEPDLLDHARQLCPDRRFALHPLPGSDRRMIGVYTR